MHNAFELKYKNANLIKRLMAYSIMIFMMNHDIDENSPLDEWKLNNKCWNGEIPSIFELDIIVDEMNKHKDTLNEEFKLNVNEWNRDDIRSLMHRFNVYHSALSQTEGKNLTALDISLKIKSYVNHSFWWYFKTSLSLMKSES